MASKQQIKDINNFEQQKWDDEDGEDEEDNDNQ